MFERKRKKIVASSICPLFFLSSFNEKFLLSTT